MDPSQCSASASPALHTHLTDTQFRGFVRWEEEWPPDSPQYLAGSGIEHRKRPPPDEVSGDVFDRQRVIPGFDQGLVERQACLVLGVGGIGQNVALTLARLGVGKIVLVDCDIYEPSNLTRQCLGRTSDVGQRKVDVAARTLKEYHALRSEVEAVHCDVILEWPRVVAMAREATAVFNGIDIGVMWDYCVNSLCKELGLPLMCGQSFGWKFMAELWTGREDDVCAFCYDSTLSAFSAHERSVCRTGGVLDRLRSFMSLKEEATPDDSASPSAVDAAGSAGCAGSGRIEADALAAFLAADELFRCHGNECTGLVRRALASAGLPALQHGSLADDLLSFLHSFHMAATQLLLPGRISTLVDIAFIPRPRQVCTRFVGSWICPCLGCAVMMVSQWAAWMTSLVGEDATGGQRRNPPQTVTFNLDFCMTSEEQLGYELGALGVSPDRSERRFCCDPRNVACSVCSAVAMLRAEEALFFGWNPVVLAPVPGSVTAMPTAWQDPPAVGTKQREAAAASALERTAPQAKLGEAYNNAVLPALPALDWERAPDEASGSLPSSSSLSSPSSPPVEWPPELSSLPMLKVPASSFQASVPSAVRGVQSGARSALVRVRRAWWRLKGCGNWDEGFPVQAVGDRGEVSVRGCCFKHTAEAELRMSQLAAEALAAAGLDVANRPVGSYSYLADPSWPLPKMGRHCAVFETMADARLGDMLLAGLLQILPHVLPVPAGYAFASLQGALATGRRADLGDLWPTAMVTSCGMRTADVAAVLASSGVSLDETAPPAAEAMGGRLRPELAGVWDAASSRLKARLTAARLASGEPSLLLWLAWRLGWECGSTVRALHAAGISWGTYRDAMGTHCNAHVNNLVVKPRGVGQGTTFLAALDFDMAFTRDAYLPEASTSVSDLGLNSWEDILNFEATMGMQMVLSGSDFASTGVTNAAPVPASHAVVEMSLRDTLVTAYDAARSGAADGHPHHEGMYDAAHELITLALCLTTHVQS